VKVLFKNGVLREGFISNYFSHPEQHRIKYTMNMEETKTLTQLHEWHLMPLYSKAQAGKVEMRAVNSIELTGLNTLWSIAATCASTAVAHSAGDLLLKVYLKLADYFVLEYPY
jgi:hypothetical protein